MTDSPVDDLLSPSFASVLGFDEPDDATLENLPFFEERDHCALTLDSSESLESKTSSESLDGHDSGKRPTCLRLELDAAKDETRALDGPAEYPIPQSSPDSNNGVDSVQGESPLHKVEQIHTCSALKEPTLMLDAPEDSAQVNQSTEEKATGPIPSHAFSASDQSQPVPPTTPVRDDRRTVRFFPPGSPRYRPSHSILHSLSSVERKQDNPSLHRQQKQQDKWKSSYRTLGQRSPPSRSPTKVNPSSSKRQPEIRFSSMSKVPFCQDASITTSTQENEHTPASEVDTVKCQTPASKRDTPHGRVYDLVVFNIGIYRSRYPQRLANGSRWGFCKIRMCPTFIPARSLTEEAEETKQIICRLQAEDLLLHFVVVVPNFVVHIPLAALAKAGRLASSRAGLSFLDIIRVAWSLVAAFINLVMRAIWGMEFGYHGTIETEYPDQACQ
ncbi:hypothetical protein N7478_004002 [Penicillium angulare]|uniref:uncharacterized protein n=1 Tax=Penicillium angulare TaxID=116970 RepID=UPI002540DE35|nr:uncharacterized protein N7478_004002 [Penicillium angulare]KAJ5278630.1 hypothetical protein N7478_004002 [Penicillium angulare]